MILPARLVFDHVGVVTANVDAAAACFGATFGAVGYTARFDDATLGVSVRFVKDAGGMVYELIAPFGDTSPVARTLKSKANLLNQVAYLTDALDAAGAQLRRNGCLPLGAAAPARAFGGRPVQFFWNPAGFVVELIEGVSHAHAYFAVLDDAA